MFKRIIIAIMLVAPTQLLADTSIHMEYTFEPEGDKNVGWFEIYAEGRYVAESFDVGGNDGQIDFDVRLITSKPIFEIKAIFINESGDKIGESPRGTYRWLKSKAAITGFRQDF